MTKLIQPTGNANTYYDEQSQTYRALPSCGLGVIWEMKNISLSGEVTEESKEELAGFDSKNIRWGLGLDGVHANIENCTFKFDYVTLTSQEAEAPNNLAHAPNSVIKDCRFIGSSEGGKFAPPQIHIDVPYQTSEIPSYAQNFINCTFWEDFNCFYVAIHESDTYSDYDVTINIENCKMGEKVFDSPGLILCYYGIVSSGVNYISKINGDTYIWDDNMPWDPTMKHWKQVTK